MAKGKKHGNDPDAPGNAARRRQDAGGEAGSPFGHPHLAQDGSRPVGEGAGASTAGTAACFMTDVSESLWVTIRINGELVVDEPLVDPSHEGVPKPWASLCMAAQDVGGIFVMEITDPDGVLDSVRVTNAADF